MGVTIVFDGITLQHAGELLLGTRAVNEIGNRCRYTYLRSLSDFALGVISGVRLSSSGGMAPNIDGDTPGLRVVQDFVFDPIESLGPFDKINVLEEGSSPRLDVEWYIGSLRSLDQPQMEFWKEHMIREINEYMGDDDSLREDLDPARYVFARKDFVHHATLQRAVPRSYRTAMFDAIYGFRLLPGINPKAVEEFIERNVVRHIATFVFYQQVTGRKALRKSHLRLSHYTRACLIENTSRALSSSGVPRGIGSDYMTWKTSHVLMPNILVPILREAKGEPDPGRAVRYRIQERATSSQYLDVREPLEEIIGLLARDDQSPAQDKIDNLVRKINNKFTETVHSSLSYRLGTSVGIDSQKQRETTSEIGHLINRAHFGWRDYEEAAREVFPKLFTQHSGQE
jgi:hypothetical protein